MNPKDKQSQY